MNDGRLVSGSRDYLIIIYNKTTYQPDLIIKDHKGAICCILQLSSGELISCSEDKTIKLFNIKGSEYQNIQSLNYHTSIVYKILELKNQILVSCSADSSIIFYCKNNFKYKKDYYISTNGSCSTIIQTKDNEICYSEYNNNKISFYDFITKKIKASIPKISKRNGIDEWFNMITEVLLAIPGENVISIVNVNQYKIIRIIKVPDSSWILGSCMINKDILITGERGNYTIRQWRIEGDNLVLISKKENTHDGDINYILNLKNGHIASGADGGIIKIW